MVKTIKLGNKDYAQVADRIKEFRSANPNGLMETSYIFAEGGMIIWKARILKDKDNDKSAEATGHAYGELKGQKAFEKLETIAIGRALAMLGYMASGEVASSEEMEEFLEFQGNKKIEEFIAFQEKVDAITTTDELRVFYTENKGKGKEFDEYIMEKSKALKNGGA